MSKITNKKSPKTRPVDARKKQVARRAAFSPGAASGPFSRIQSGLPPDQLNDQYEREAEQISENMENPPSGNIPAITPISSEVSSSLDKLRNSGATTNISMQLTESLQHPGRGAGLIPSTRAFLESKFGVDLGGVRVHDSQRDQQMARRFQASAFTHGQDIWLGPQSSQQDTQLMAHETTHVLQQGANTAGTPIVQRQAEDSEAEFATNMGQLEDIEPEMTQNPDIPISESTRVIKEHTAPGNEGNIPPNNISLAQSASTPSPPGGAASSSDSPELEKPPTMDEIREKSRRKEPKALAPGSAASAASGNREGAGGVENVSETVGPETAESESGEAGSVEKEAANQDQSEESEGETEAEGEEGEEEGDEPAGGGQGADGGGGGVPAGPGGGSDEVDLSELSTGDLALIDTELAEHERWAAATRRVGVARSVERAAFIAESAGGGLLSGVATGAAMGLGMGLIGRAAARFIPLPGVGGILGGAMSVYGLATRDWDQTAATISAFGEGSSTYEVLANSIAAIAEVIDIVSNILGVINGIVGVLQAVVYGLIAAAAVAAFFTFGATAGFIPVLVSIQEVLTAIELGINIATTVMDVVNAAVLQPCVVLFRALHMFTTDADPRQVEADGAEIATAASASGAALGAWAGGKLAETGSRRPGPERGETHRTDADPPPRAAEGDGPTVSFERPHGAGADVDVPTRMDSDATAPRDTATGQPGEQLSLPGIDGATPTPHATGRAGEVEAPVAKTDSDAQLSLPGMEGSADSSLTGMRTETVGTPTGELANMTDANIDAALSHMESGTYFEMPGQNPRTGEGLQDIQTRTSDDPNVIQYHENFYMTDVAPPRIADASEMPPPGMMPDPDAAQLTLPGMTPTETVPRAPGESVIPPGVGITGDPVPTSRIGDAPGVEGQRVHLRYHSENPNAPAGAHSRTEPTVQIDTPHDRFGWQGDPSVRVRPREGYYLLPTGEWKRIKNMTPAERAAAHYPVGGSNPPPLGPTPSGGGTSGQGGGGGSSGGGGWEQLSLDLGEQSMASGHIPFTESRNPNQLSRGRTDTPSLGGSKPGQPTVIVDEAALGLPPGSVQTSQPTTPKPPSTPRTDVDWSKVSIEDIRKIDFDPTKQAYGGSQEHGPYQGALGMTVTDPHTGKPVYKPEAYFNVTPPDSPSYVARAGPGGSYADHVFTDPNKDRAQAKAQEYAARTAASGESTIRSQSSLPHGWPPDAKGDIYPGNPVDQMRVFEVAPNTPYISSVVAPQPEGRPQAGRPDVYPGGGPQVQLPRGSVKRDSAPIAEFPIPPSENVPPSSAPAESRASQKTSPASQQAETSGATQPRPYNLFPHAVDATKGVLRQQQQEEGSYYKRQQAAFNAQFAEGNQLAAGTSVERVNPDYPTPPGTPQQLEAIQNEILNLLATRAATEHVERNMEAEVEQHTANQAPIQEAVGETAGAITAAQAHQQAVMNRQAANQEQQTRQQEAQGLIAGYPSRVTGLTAITLPLMGFERFTHYASKLPGSAGRKMLQMNTDATEMLAAFAQMDVSMAEQNQEQPNRQAELQSDQSRLEDTNTQSVTSQQDLTVANQGAQGLRQVNNRKLSEANQALNEARDEKEQLSEGIVLKQDQARQLTEEMRAWAEAHQAAREEAIAETVRRLEKEGYIITDQTEN